MGLLRVARQSEVGEGQKIVKEAHGRKLLLIRQRGQVYCTDAHCFHMGAALEGGDIEDSGANPCIVCPAHRYRIELCSGRKVDKTLDGSVCKSADQKQRIYDVHTDPDFIWVALPDGPTSPLPSDTYNQVSLYPGQAQGNFGLFGNVPGILRPSLEPPTPLQPYAGDGGRPLVHSPTSMVDDAGLQLSQESDAGGDGVQRAQQQDPVVQRLFAGRVDAPHVARRKAAVAAIRAKAYKPPTAAVSRGKPSTPVTQQDGQRTLFESWHLGANRRDQGPTDMDTM